jgi:hypothetical protein
MISGFHFSALLDPFEVNHGVVSRHSRPQILFMIRAYLFTGTLLAGDPSERSTSLMLADAVLRPGDAAEDTGATEEGWRGEPVLLMRRSMTASSDFFGEA